MTKTTLSLARAKESFSECIRRAESGEPVLITRYGRPIAALVAARDLDDLTKYRSEKQQGTLLELMGVGKDLDEFVAELETAVEQRGPSRPGPDFE